MLNGYITTLEAAQKWNISARQVQILCKNNRIEGAVQINRIYPLSGPGYLEYVPQGSQRLLL